MVLPHGGSCPFAERLRSLPFSHRALLLCDDALTVGFALLGAMTLVRSLTVFVWYFEYEFVGWILNEVVVDLVAAVAGLLLLVKARRLARLWMRNNA